MVPLFSEDLGDPHDPAVILVMGVPAQLPMWPDGFCQRLLDSGYRVIRFDNRDCGLSTKLDGQKAPGSVQRRVVAGLRGEQRHRLQRARQPALP